MINHHVRACRIKGHGKRGQEQKTQFHKHLRREKEDEFHKHLQSQLIKHFQKTKRI